MRGSTQLDGLWRVIVTRPLGVGCLLLLGLGASLTWAAVPLEAEQPRRAEVLVGRRLGRTPPIREYLATHSQPPNSEAHIIPSAQRYFRPGAPSRAGGNGSAPGSFVTDPMLSADSTSSTNFIDPVLQSSQGTTSVSAPLVSFDGINNTVAPPDANISVGTDQIVEIVNYEFQVFDKAGSGLLPNGPAAFASIFRAAVGGNLVSSDPCAETAIRSSSTTRLTRDGFWARGMVPVPTTAWQFLLRATLRAAMTLTISP